MENSLLTFLTELVSVECGDWRRVPARPDVFSDQISWGINLPNWGRAVRIVTRYEKLRGKC